MRNKTNIIIFILALLVVGTVLAITKISINRNAVAVQEQEIENSFTEEQYNMVKLDTFIHLLHKAYDPNISTQITKNQLIVELKNANQITKDFFNGNDALLKYSIEDFGFELKYNKDNNNIHSIFAIKKEAIAVPNDVMMKIVDKIYN